MQSKMLNILRMIQILLPDLPIAPMKPLKMMNLILILIIAMMSRPQPKIRERFPHRAVGLEPLVQRDETGMIAVEDLQDGGDDILFPALRGGRVRDVVQPVEALDIRGAQPARAVEVVQAEKGLGVEVRDVVFL